MRRSQLDPLLQAWLHDNAACFDSLLSLLSNIHDQRVARLASMADTASRQLWWPFTQHASLKEGAVQVRPWNRA